MITRLAFQCHGPYPMPTILPDGSYKTDEDGKQIITPIANADSLSIARDTRRTLVLGLRRARSVLLNRMPRPKSGAVSCQGRQARGEWNR